MTKGELLSLGKLLLTFAVLLGIPLWELYALRKDGRTDDSATAAQNEREG